jgi:hypothetical protein
VVDCNVKGLSPRTDEISTTVAFASTFAGNPYWKFFTDSSRSVTELLMYVGSCNMLSSVSQSDKDDGVIDAPTLSNGAAYTLDTCSRACDGTFGCKYFEFILASAGATTGDCKIYKGNFC